MTTAETSNAKAIVASIAQKVEQGSITNEDINKLRAVFCENPEAIPRLDRSLINGTTPTATASNSNTMVVKCVGMVQNMLETEYYLAETRFRDALVPSQKLDDARNLAERQQLEVVPVPFSSKWTREQNKFLIEPFTSKQSFLDAIRVAGRYSAIPRHVDRGDIDDYCLAWWPPKRFHSDANACPVLAKMYYNDDEPQDEDSSSPRHVKLNDVVELVGVVSFDSMDADFSQQDHLPQDFDFCTPPNLLPRLHVLCHRQVHLERVVDTTGDSTLHQVAVADDDRSFCIQALAQHVFGGNTTAAEALLMACMSMAERQELASEQTQTSLWAPIQTPSGTTLGCASLNILLSSPEACTQMAKRLEQVLSQILPVVGLVTLYREILGTTVVSPAKDEHTGRLVPSPLQLPKGSALVIDESKLTQGPLTDHAEETLRAFHSLTHHHKVPYRFEGRMYYNFEADYRIVVVSKSTTTTTTSSTTTGSKLLPCLLTMTLSNDMDEEQPAPGELSREDCTRIRLYLEKCRCNPNDGEEVMNVALSNNLLEQAQHDFVDKRTEYRTKKEGKQVDEADFHRWLTLARLQARSRIPGGGLSDENMDRQVWADTLRLDEAMRGEATL